MFIALSWNSPCALGVGTVARFGRRRPCQCCSMERFLSSLRGWGHGEKQEISLALCPTLPPLSLTLLALWSHWSSVRVRCCLGRAASVLRDQSWLSPSLHGWIWCQGQGKAAAAAPEHHPRTCLLVKVLVAPGEAPAFHSKSLQSTETQNVRSQAQSVVPARDLHSPAASGRFIPIPSDSLQFICRTQSLTSHFRQVYKWA